jgi:hypothetical protein
MSLQKNVQTQVAVHLYFVSSRNPDSVGHGAIYWKSIVALPWAVIGIAIGVFAIAGAIWSTFQWFRRVNTKARYYNEKYGSTLSESQMEQLKREVSASEHKALITGWIAFWPWDMFWTITGDFFNMIYDALAGVYQNISNRAVSKFTVVQPKKNKEGFVVDAEGNQIDPRHYRNR